MERITLLYAVDSVRADAGTEKQIVELVRRLDRHRFETHVCCLEDSERLKELAPYCQCRVFPAERIFSPSGLRQILRMRRYIERHQVDIVQTFMVKAAIAATLAAWKSSCRIVVASRRNLGYWQRPFDRRLFRFLNRRTTRWLANSESARRVAIEMEGMPPDRVDVLYNGVDLERYSPEPAAPPGNSGEVPEGWTTVVGVVANLRPVKGVDLFLRAARVVSAHVPAARFLVAGEGPLRHELGRLSSELGIPELVHFTEGRGSVPDHLHRMCIGCLPSRSESFSNAILEYMAAGLPVVATDTGGNAEAVENGVTGYIVCGDDPEAFARPIIELLRDPSRRLAMGRRGRERCRERFEIVEAVRRHEQYYSALCREVYGR